jgi:DNA-3-methyladenine glycosylase
VKPLSRAFFERPADLVAPELLGARIRSRVGGCLTEGLIVETEAYLGFDDPASHAFRGRLHDGNRNLYGPPGTWYVYRSYGIHWCANLVCRGPESGSAVLLRGITPIRGVAQMQKRRGSVTAGSIANGPGKLCQALGISRELDGLPMPGSLVRVYGPETVIPIPVVVTPRIGISKAVEWPLRFVLSEQAA